MRHALNNFLNCRAFDAAGFGGHRGRDRFRSGDCLGDAHWLGDVSCLGDCRFGRFDGRGWRGNLDLCGRSQISGRGRPLHFLIQRGCRFLYRDRNRFCNPSRSGDGGFGSRHGSSPDSNFLTGSVRA